MDCGVFSLFGGKKSKQMKSNSNDNQMDSSCLNSGQEDKDRDQDGDDQVKYSVSARYNNDNDEYNNDHLNAGIALIFNHKYVKGHEQRKGTEIDRDAIRETLAAYGFVVRIFDDLTFIELTNTLKATAKEDHSLNDCLIVVVMSHGGADGKLYARDHSYPVERLWQSFLGDNCPTLINKPKLFFIQACRGQKLDTPVSYTRIAARSMKFDSTNIQKSRPITYAIPNTADILIMYSTFENHYSFRNVENGSWFIQSLCRTLKEAAIVTATATGAAAVQEVNDSKGVNLLHLLTSVNRRVAYDYQSNSPHDYLNCMKEMPNFLSTLTKHFYLRPKH